MKYPPIKETCKVIKFASENDTIGIAWAAGIYYLLFQVLIWLPIYLTFYPISYFYNKARIIYFEIRIYLIQHS